MRKVTPRGHWNSPVMDKLNGPSDEFRRSLSGLRKLLLVTSFGTNPKTRPICCVVFFCGLRARQAVLYTFPVATSVVFRMCFSDM